jgi:hypothetical protein
LESQKRQTKQGMGRSFVGNSQLDKSLADKKLIVVFIEKLSGIAAWLNEGPRKPVKTFPTTNGQSVVILPSFKRIGPLKLLRKVRTGMDMPLIGDNAWESS